MLERQGGGPNIEPKVTATRSVLYLVTWRRLNHTSWHKQAYPLYSIPCQFDTQMLIFIPYSISNHNSTLVIPSNIYYNYSTYNLQCNTSFLRFSTVPPFFKVFLEIQDKFNSEPSYSKIQWHRVNIPITKEEQSNWK